jgi:hypothetical protein
MSTSVAERSDDTLPLESAGVPRRTGHNSGVEAVVDGHESAGETHECQTGQGRPDGEGSPMPLLHSVTPPLN